MPAEAMITVITVPSRIHGAAGRHMNRAGNRAVATKTSTNGNMITKKSYGISMRTEMFTSMMTRAT